MKRSMLFLGLAVGAVGLWASAALADVFVTADITKTKDLTVDETVDVHKFVWLFTFDFIPVDASSETHVYKNQRNQFNFVEDENAQATATIDSDTGSGASGIVLINQSPGFINNQGNEVSVTYATTPGNPGYRPAPSASVTLKPAQTFAIFTDPITGATTWKPLNCGTCEEPTSGTPSLPGTDVAAVTTPLSITNASSAEVDHWDSVTAGVFAHAEVSVEQINGFSPDTDSVTPEQVVQPSSFANEYVNTFGATLADSIDGAFADGSGVAGVNQAAGSLNNQNNALAAALGDSVVHALGEADLGQFNTYNNVDVIDQVRTDTISNAFNGFTGVAMVNQSSGSINNQANVVDIAVGTSVTFPPIAP